MKYWCDFIQREDLENEAGLVDMDIVRTLSVNTLLLYIGDFIKLGEHDLQMPMDDHIEDFLTDDYMSYMHAVEGRYPEPEEITSYLKKPETLQAREYWAYVCSHANRDNWPYFEELIRKDWNVPEEVHLKNEDRIERMMQETAEGRDWDMREL